MRSTDLLGFLLMGNALAVVAWWLMSNKPNAPYAVVVCSIVIFIGLIFIFNERISEITIAHVGSIKTAAKQATVDAAEIAALKSRIEGQAATVDLVAGKAIEAERLSKELSTKNEIAGKNLAVIEATLEKAEKTVASLEALASFTNTVVAAQSDDRKAFDQLEKWSMDKSFPYHERAAQAHETIFNASAKPFGIHYDVPWKPGVDPSKKTFEDLKREIDGAPFKEAKYALLQYIASRSDITLKDRVDYFSSVMRSDGSLNTVEIAGQCFTQLTKLKIKPLAVSFLLQWWSENRDKDPAQLEKAAEAINLPFGGKSPEPTISP